MSQFVRLLLWDPDNLTYRIATGSVGAEASVEVVNTVAVSAASWPLPTGAATEAKQDTGNSTLSLIKAKTDNFDVALSTKATSAKQDTIISNLQAINSLVPAVYDYIDLSYTGDNLTGVVFKSGGAGGATVSNLTLGYTGSNLTSVTKS